MRAVYIDTTVCMQYTCIYSEATVGMQYTCIHRGDLTSSLLHGGPTAVNRYVYAMDGIVGNAII